MIRPAVLLIATVVAAGAAAAEVPTPPPSPYAGQEGRAIKALSADEIRDLREGRGMGLAKPAELNGYAGPAHVLELARPLGLDARQEAATRELHARMLADARRLGAAILEAETHLERMFAARHIDAASLRARVAAIAELQGQLRAVHLDAHLVQTALLTPAQVARYVELRGYRHGDPPAGHGRHAH